MTMKMKMGLLDQFLMMLVFVKQDCHRQESMKTKMKVSVIGNKYNGLNKSCDDTSLAVKSNEGLLDSCSVATGLLL